MGSSHIFIGLSLFMVLVVSDSQICPVLEGREITLTCKVLFRSYGFSKEFYWRKKVNGAAITVAVCDRDNRSFTLSQFTLRYTVTVTNINASSTTSNIKILSAARTDQGSWFCVGPFLTQDASACDLKVFATPTSVSCSQPELQYDNVLVTCTGDRVYPQPLCQFTWFKNGIELSTNNVTVKNQTLSQSQNTDYYYPECTWTIPVQALNFGSHQFYALIYPNVTGNTTTDMSYGRNSSLTSPVEINYICRAEVLHIWSENKTFVPEVAYPPAITNFTVTGTVNQEVQDNTNVMFSCEAEGNPAPSLTLLRDSDSQILGQTDSNNKAILRLNKTMACQDSDIYVCKAQTQEGGGEETMEIYVLCKQQLAPTESQNSVYTAQVKQIFNIYITVIGYPEPQLSLQSSTALQKNAYSLAYYTKTPGNGAINFTIYTMLEAYYQKYELNITNTQGTFVYSFEIKAVTETAEASNNTDLVPVVGVLAGIIFIILVAAAIYIAWRKGILNRFTRKENRPVLRYTVGVYEDKDVPITQYEHSLFDIGSSKPGQMADPGNVKTVEPSSPYACIDDNPSHTADVAYMNYVPNRDTQTCSPYEEIKTVPANSSSSVTTDMREDLPYST